MTSAAVHMWRVPAMTTGAKQSRSGPAKSEPVTVAACVSEPLPPNISSTSITVLARAVSVPITCERDAACPISTG